MGKSTIFNSYVKLPEGKTLGELGENHPNSGHVPAMVDVPMIFNHEILLTSPLNIMKSR
jgi:hypothetical protein